MAQPKEVGEDRLPEMGTIEHLDEESVYALAAEDGQPTEFEPSAEQDDTEATVEKAQPESKPKTQGKPNKKNLDEDEDFRKYKSARDKREAEIKAEYERKLRERDEQLQQRELAQQQAMLSGLQQGLANAVDDQERAQYIDQIAAIKSQTYVSQERAWAKYVREEVTKEGLAMDDFDPTKYRGTQGLIQFERDLAKAAKEKYAKEAKEYKQMASPESIAELVKKQVAKALREQGMDTTVEAGSPAGGGSGNGASVDRDLAAVQMGRMTSEQFKKRHPDWA